MPELLVLKLRNLFQVLKRLVVPELGSILLLEELFQFFKPRLLRELPRFETAGGYSFLNR